jgi:hypothetical protein
LTQFGRSDGVGPGDLVIYDAGATFDYVLRAKTQLVKIPRRLLESRLDRPGDFVARKIVRSNPLSPLLGDLLGRSLDIDTSHEFGPSIAKRLSNAIVELVALFAIFNVTACLRPEFPGRSRERCGLRANLDDPELGPGALAAAGAMSVRRHRHIKFAWSMPNGGSLSKVMLKGLRLSRCSKGSTLRFVHDAFHLRTVDPGDDETGWRSDRG